MDFGSRLNCLSFNLSRAARAMARSMEEAAREAGLSAPQFTTLSVLDMAGEMTVGGLAERLGTDRTTLTRNLDLLGREGLIAARPSGDRRIRAFGLTGAGRERLAVAMPAWTAWQRAQVGRMGEDEARRLLEALHRL